MEAKKVFQTVAQFLQIPTPTPILLAKTYHTLSALLLPPQEVLTKTLEKEVHTKIINNPICKKGILSLIFNHTNFKALCTSSLPGYTKGIIFTELLKDPPSPFRSQFTKHYRWTASHLNNMLVSFQVSNILFNYKCLIFILSREWYQS